jgi:uncharacterized protein
VTRVLVDTSAFFAALDATDQMSRASADGWSRLVAAHRVGEVEATTHSGVVVECSALVQRRLGMEAVRALHRDLFPLVDVVWVDEALHERSVSALLAADRRDVSLVDWTSFELMRAEGIRTAFAFDDDFERQGFSLW